MLARLTQLFRNLLIYGLGDVATSIISFFLFPLYVRYLSPEDYGVIGLLLTIEVVSKILFRWGVDASFMRLYFDCQDQRERQRLASTIFFFLLAANGSMLGIGLLAAPWIALHLFGKVMQVTALRLVLVNTFVVGFYFIPFHVLRIKGRSSHFVSLTIARSLATIALRLVFVVLLKWGVLGVVLADVFVTAGFTAVLARWFAPLIRPTFSTSALRATLGFGLPRVPHGVAHQVIAVADRYILTQFVSIREIGLYSIGATFALTMKLFLSAFEYAWAPFYFATMGEKDAKRTFSVVTTYGLAILALLVAGMTVTSADVVRLMTKPEFYPAARVIPWVAMGVFFQGVYLLTSIGLNITKRSAYYPVATMCAAATSVTANLLLVPRFGVVSAAWANATAYAVLALVGMQLSRRFYPIPYEWSRLIRIAVSSCAAIAITVAVVPSQLSPLVGFLVRGTTVTASYVLLLVAMGFHQPHEIAAVYGLFTRMRSRAAAGPAAVSEDTTELAGEVASTPLNDADPLPAGYEHVGAATPGTPTESWQKDVKVNPAHGGLKSPS